MYYSYLKMNNNISEKKDTSYASYKKICTDLLEEYGKCILEKKQPTSMGCTDKLDLIQKWCMNPVGVIRANNNKY